MKITITKKAEVEVKTLAVSAGVRYWENATVNGVEDTEGDLIPLRRGDRWEPIISLENGKIFGWPSGTTASLHYKVCDDGVYKLIDAEGALIYTKDGYVPDVMCPKDEGHGDYIIMDIDGDGMIQNWECDLSDFTDDNE